MEQSSDVLPLLHGDLRNARQWFAVLVQRCGVANHKYPWMTRNGQIVFFSPAPRAVRGDAQPPSRRRRRNAGGPDDRLAGNALACDDHALFIDLIDSMPEADLDTKFLQPLG